MAFHTCSAQTVAAGRFCIICQCLSHRMFPCLLYVYFSIHSTDSNQIAMRQGRDLRRFHTVTQCKMAVGSHNGRPRRTSGKRRSEALPPLCDFTRRRRQNCGSRATVQDEAFVHLCFSHRTLFRISSLCARPNKNQGCCPTMCTFTQPHSMKWL